MENNNNKTDDLYNRHDNARRDILNEVLNASNIYFPANQMRFINDAMEMYAMYREAILNKEIQSLQSTLSSRDEEIKRLQASLLDVTKSSLLEIKHLYEEITALKSALYNKD